MVNGREQFGALVALLLLLVAPACAACANAPASYATSWRPSNPRRCTHERQISPLNPVSHVQVLQEEAATGNLSWHGEHNQSPPRPMHQFTRWLPVGVRGHLAVHHPSHTLCLTRRDPRYIQFTFTERWGDIQGSSIAHMIWGKLPPRTAWTETP
jgi:hypothetical protein